MNDKREVLKMEAKQGVVCKWLLVPFSILTVTGAAASLSLWEDWDTVVELQGYKKQVKDWILFVVLFGYLGSNPGLVTHFIGHIGAYILAIILTLVSYIGLGVCATIRTGHPWHLFFTMLFLYLASFASSIAIVATISETLQNFSKRAGNFYIVLMIVYTLLAYSFEESLRNGILRGIPTQYYYPILGVLVAIVYSISCLLSKLVVIEDFYSRITISQDVIGMLSLLLLSGVMIVVNYICFLVNYEYTLYFIIFLVVLILNFVLAYFIIQVSHKTIDSPKPYDEFLEDEDQTVTMDLIGALRDYRLYGLLIGTFIIIGTSTTFLKNIRIIKTANHAMAPASTYSSLYLLCQSLGALICGLVGSYSNQFLFGTIGAILAITGYFSIIFLSWFYVETILIGLSNGIWWVLAPLIVYRFFGPKPFAGVWGSVLTINFWGMLLLGLVFTVFWEQHHKPLPWSLGIFSGACFFAIIVLGLILNKNAD
ncbi:unnamed protein product [Moneuplotes crassus]|uniref:Uncharacterized protein n=1 Tax=Euplotes crassus TaxID=5936 RepID=A0AAD1U427_EUPCR|nr:unnamed protein product [Moneuplotes crassus]